MKSNPFTVVRFVAALLTVLAIAWHPYIPPKTLLIHPKIATSPGIYGPNHLDGSSSVAWINQVNNEWRCDFSRLVGSGSCGYTLSWDADAVTDNSDDSQENSLICKRDDSDSDGDGWGWENDQSCRVMVQPSGPNTSIREGPPLCKSAASDPDGDGWGWENEQSCTVPKEVAASTKDEEKPPYCVSAASDPDGDGWGWENNQSCLIVKTTSDKSIENKAVSGLDFGLYDGLRVRIRYEGPARHLRIHLRNHNSSYSQKSDVYASKFMSAYVRTNDLNSGSVFVSLSEFSVAEWWVTGINASRELAAPEFDNVIGIGVDVMVEGLHKVRVERVELEGARISSESFLMALLLFWVAYLFMEASTRYYQLYTSTRIRERQIYHLANRAAQLEAEKFELTTRSVTDALTGIFNRAGLVQQQQRLYSEAHIDFGLMVLDIDNFKKINDTYGHVVGDQILKTFTKLISSSTRKDDIFGRWGGEEFVLVCPHTPPNNLIELGEKLRAEVEHHRFGTAKEINVTISIGVSIVSKNEKFEEVFKRADIALYQAKKTRNSVTFDDGFEV